MACLVGRRLERVVKRENDWVFSFGDEVALIVGAPWRLIVDGRNEFGDCDHDQQFGLPTPVNGIAETGRFVTGKSVKAVSIRTTGDLRLAFDDEAVREMIQTSCGYEAWELSAPKLKIVAQGGGQLAIWKG